VFDSPEEIAIYMPLRGVQKIKGFVREAVLRKDLGLPDCFKMKMDRPKVLQSGTAAAGIGRDIKLFRLARGLHLGRRRNP
jgi:hypothetical protein